MLSKDRSNQPEKRSMQNEAKNVEFFIFFKKRLGKDFLLDSPWFVYSWTLQKCKKPHSNIILVSNLMWDSSEVLNLQRFSFFQAFHFFPPFQTLWFYPPPLVGKEVWVTSWRFWACNFFPSMKRKVAKKSRGTINHQPKSFSSYVVIHYQN